MVFFSVRGRNLAPEGRPYLSAAPGNNASKTNDLKTISIFRKDTCTQSGFGRNAWWRVDFVKLVEVYGLEIMRGKLNI